MTAAPDRPDTAAEVGAGVEAVARAMWDAVKDDSEWHHLSPSSRDRWRAAAIAALAARRPATEAEQTVERCAGVAAQYEAYVAACKTEGIDYDETLETAAADIRRALGGVARDEQRGRCGNQAPAIAGIAQTAVHCKLPAGHAGWHKGDDSEWMFRPYRGAARDGSDG